MRLISVTYEDTILRAVMMDEQIYYVGVDIAEAAGYTGRANAVNYYCYGRIISNIPTSGGLQPVALITEKDALTLASARSKKNYHFRTWLPKCFKEVREKFERLENIDLTHFRRSVSKQISHQMSLLLNQGNYNHFRFNVIDGKVTFEEIQVTRPEDLPLNNDPEDLPDDEL